MPHEYNPRVPRALGEVCWRMLRKQPGGRYADALAVEAAIGEAVMQADEAWRVPLCEAWGLHHATTVHERDMWGGADLRAFYERLAAYARLPVRGKPRPRDEVSTLPCAEHPPGFESLDAPPVCEAEAPPPPRAPKAAMPATRSRRALQLAGAVLVLGLSLWLAVRPPSDASPHTTPPEGTPRATLPLEFFPIILEPGGQEVAPWWKQPEGAGSSRHGSWWRRRPRRSHSRTPSS